MIQNLDSAAQKYLLDLDRIHTSITRATRKMSSGLAVESASDAPDQISDILQLHVEIQRNAQIRTNLERVQTEVATASSAIENSIKVIDRARVLGSQGANTNQSAETRRILGSEVEGLVELLVNASAAIVNNRYVFSGDDDRTQAYRMNLANANGVDRLITAPATRQLLHPSGTTFAVSMTAGDIFDRRNADDSLANDNAFAAVNQLRLALENNDQAGIDTALANLRSAGDRLSSALSFYGTVENRIDEALNFASSYDVQLQTELSNRRDADITAAILELQRGQTIQQAAYGARSATPSTSLFDYLKY